MSGDYVIPLDELRSRDAAVVRDQMYTVKAITDLDYRAELEAILEEKECLERSRLADAQYARHKEKR